MTAAVVRRKTVTKSEAGAADFRWASGALGRAASATDSPKPSTCRSRKILRVETRTLQILTTTRAIGFPYAKQVVRITRERVVTATGKRGVEVVYAICSLPFEQTRPAKIATWLRQHWGIANSLHWVRDVTYDGDRSTTHIGNGAQFMASLRNTAINRHRLDGATNIADACRATALTVNRRLDLLSPRNPSSGHKPANCCGS
jgi:hypothetical protein